MPDHAQQFPINIFPKGSCFQDESDGGRWLSREQRLMRLGVAAGSGWHHSPAAGTSVAELSPFPTPLHKATSLQLDPAAPGA